MGGIINRNNNSNMRANSNNHFRPINSNQNAVNYRNQEWTDTFESSNNSRSNNVNSDNRNRIAAPVNNINRISGGSNQTNQNNINNYNNNNNNYGRNGVNSNQRSNALPFNQRHLIVPLDVLGFILAQ